MDIADKINGRSEMIVSVIIPTYNGAHRIMNVLRSLEKQLYKPDEVIVVIDGSTDGTAELVGNSSFQLKGLKIINQENRGRAQVRNRGAREANGDLLLFVDDDMVAPETWVKEHLAHHQSFPDSIVTGKLEGYNAKNADDFQKFRIWLHKKWDKGMPVALDSGSSKPLTSPYITANNFSIPKKLFKQLDGFDSRLRDAEDYDLAVRALSTGIPVYFSNKAICFNNDVDNVNCQKYIKRFREYTAAQGVLQNLKPEIYGRTHQYASTVPKGVKGKIFLTLCSNWWINSVDKGLWKWIPEVIRFKLYDMVVTANGVFYPDKVKL
jgi:glycosyltransferase involved in cell wall biosynthesis